MPFSIERALLPGHVTNLLDYDDAVFHYYDQHRKPLVKRILAGKHPELMRNAALRGRSAKAFLAGRGC